MRTICRSQNSRRSKLGFEIAWRNGGNARKCDTNTDRIGIWWKMTPDDLGRIYVNLLMKIETGPIGIQMSKDKSPVSSGQSGFLQPKTLCPNIEIISVSQQNTEPLKNNRWNLKSKFRLLWIQTIKALAIAHYEFSSRMSAAADKMGLKCWAAENPFVC